MIISKKTYVSMLVTMTAGVAGGNPSYMDASILSKGQRLVDQILKENDVQVLSEDDYRKARDAAFEALRAEEDRLEAEVSAKTSN